MNMWRALLLATGVFLMANKFPVAAGLPQFQSIPELYATDVIIEARPRTVTHMITNNLFEPELRKHGDTMKFFRFGDVGIRSWVKGGNITTDELQDEEDELVIDTGDYYSFRRHKIDDIQILYKRYENEFIKTAAQNYAEKVDVRVFTRMVMDAYISGPTYNGIYDFGTDVSPIPVTKDNAVNILLNIQSAIDETVWGDSPRWVVAPILFFNALAQSDLGNMSIVGGTGISPRREGIHKFYDIPLMNMTVIPSNLLPKTGGTGLNAVQPLLFGTKRAMAFVTQMESMDILPGRDNEPPCQYHRGFWASGMKKIHTKEIGKAFIVPHADLLKVR